VTGATHSPAALLRMFVDTHRGLRLGSLFGAPGVFVGRRAAIRLEGDAVVLRLTPAGQDLARALCRRRVRDASRGWLRLDVARASTVGPAACFTLFERAVRDAALESDLRGAGTAA
jgi:hypothetical protein